MKFHWVQCQVSELHVFFLRLSAPLSGLLLLPFGFVLLCKQSLCKGLAHFLRITLSELGSFHTTFRPTDHLVSVVIGAKPIVEPGKNFLTISQ